MSEMGNISRSTSSTPVMLKRFGIFGAFALATYFNGCAIKTHQSRESPGTHHPKVPGFFVDLSSLSNVVVELRYATTNNICGRNLYGDFNKAYLHPEAFAKFVRASELLSQKYPGYKFVVYDALRPRSVQRELFAVVHNTPMQNYVANPDEGSVHNFGFALDLTVAGPDGVPLDMGAGFDQMDALSEPRYEEELLRQDRLKPMHIKNRFILRSIMEEAGFKELIDEWWHFDAVPGDIVRQTYPIVE